MYVSNNYIFRCLMKDIEDMERELKYHKVFTQETLDVCPNDTGADLSMKCRVEDSEFCTPKV